MPRATLAQMPGTQRTVEWPEDHEGDFTLRDFFASAGIDPNDGRVQRDISVNGDVVTDLETVVPDGATVVFAERVKGAH